MNRFRIPGRVMLLMLMFTMLPLIVRSQTYLSRSYTVNDGLASPTINDITQDKTGRMWFATPIGITCYDGTTWKNYSSTAGLPFQIYNKIRADNQGNIWAFTNYLGDGIYFFDSKRQSWHHLDRPADIGENIIFITSVSMMEHAGHPEGICFGIGTKQRGFYIYTKRGWVHAGKGQEKSWVLKVICHNHLFYLIIDNLQSTSAAGSQSNYFVIDPDRPHDWRQIDFKTPSPNIYSIAIEKFPSTPKGSVYVSEPRIWLTGKRWAGYYFQDHFHLLYRGEFPGFHKDAHYKELITLPDQFEGFWVANSRVLLNIDKTGKIKLIGMPETLPAVGANSLFYDRESNFWIGTYRGIIKITSFRFENYRRKDGLYDDEVTAIEEFSSKDLVFGHNSGFTFFIDNQFYPVEIPGSDRKNIIDSRVMDLCRDREGNIWAAVSRMGLMKISPTRQMKWCPVIINGKLNQRDISFSSVLCDSSGNIWASGDHYIFQWKTNRFIPFKTGLKRNFYIRRLFESNRDTIYIAAHGEGLLQLKANKIKQFRCLENEDANSIYAVYTEEKGNVLVGTQMGLFTLENNTLVKFRHNDFQVNRPVYFITGDRDGCLWFGLNNGVIKWDRTNRNHFRHYTMADGLAGNETNRGASFVDHNSRTWIGTEQGVSCYYKEKDRICKIPPLLELHYLNVSGQPQRYPLNRDHAFQYYLDDLTFYFKGISFIDEKAVRYNFKLEGIDRQWITNHRVPDNYIRYLNVPPGKYRFHIQASNSLGTKSPMISSGLITIKKPFFHTWWFYFMVFIAIILLIFFIANFISKKRYTAHLEEQIRQRTKQLEVSGRELRNIFNGAHDAIIIMDPNDEIIYDVNNRACEIYGFSRLEFVGMSLETISKHVNRGKKRINETLQKGDYLHFETIQYRKDGSEMYLEVNASVITYRGRLAILSINRDISDRKRAEQQIKESLKEKEILLKEIHHRVKNNLQVISSLLDLQVDTLKDENTIKAFQNSKDRIYSMALVHENLYRFGDLARINGKEYIHNLVEYFFDTYGGLAEAIIPTIQIETPSLLLEMDTAIPIGLILTELLSNALKHAFPPGERGEIHIAIGTETPGTLTLSVSDNGVGLPQDFEIKESHSLGLQLVHLLTRQVKGTIKVERKQGTTVTITFPYKEHK
ncbi:MAG: PAS domain S-box protein [Candidatus Aminicenantes bacterium]|nr:MAG: PAS domain S-box protein [Candidatus Aminicenantes bacterium]